MSDPQLHQTDMATKAFILGVIVVDLLAVVYFGGMWITTGSPLPAHGKHAEHIVVAAAKNPVAKVSAPVAAPPAFDYTAYVADASKGELVAAKCKACHTFNQGGANRTGPNLWGIYGNKTAHADGFAYSSAMLAMEAEWGEMQLMGYLENPRVYLPGTNMQFNGIRKPEDRADLIAWLKTLK